MPGFLDGTRRLAFGLTEPGHGSDATYLETTAVADGDEWVLNGQKRFNSGLHHATHDIVFARTSGEHGSPVGISAFGMIASILGAFTVKTKANATGKDLSRALHRGTNVAAARQNRNRRS